MRYSIIFATAVAASEAYKYDNDDTLGPRSTEKFEYATIYPGYGKNPVTMTSQYQAFPTCVSADNENKKCTKWSQDQYVSTVINDFDGNSATITKVNEIVTVYHAQSTRTHTSTITHKSSGDAAATTEYKLWHELYEKIYEAEFSMLGKHALRGYPGSGLSNKDEYKQPVHVKEYKYGKWDEYDFILDYSPSKTASKRVVVPTSETTTYSKTGVYTIPANDVTIYYPVIQPAEATAVARAGESFTYGGAYIDVRSPGTVIDAYGAYETKVIDNKFKTENILKYTTFYASTIGRYHMVKPTTTVYSEYTEVRYPTTQYHAPGVYHYAAETITITKPNQAYTYNGYQQIETYAIPTVTPAYENGEYAFYPTST
ncbi:hypothetical protein P153DRAFT_259346, partial [Dothidotthia symphoricarpi CBS 119687]